MASHQLFITPSILRQLMQAYFPPELLRGMNLKESGLIGDNALFDDGKQILQGILRTTNKRLKLYGTPEMISIDLFLFREFSGSTEYFEMNWKENYGFYAKAFVTDPAYRHLTVPRFKFKQDMYSGLQAVIYDALGSMNPVPYAVCSLFLKLKAKQVSDTFEIVPYTGFYLPDEVDNVMQPVREAISNGLPAEHQFRRPQVDSFEKIYEKFRELFWGCRVEEYEHELKSTLREYYTMYPPTVEMKKYAEMYYICKFLIDGLRKIIDELPVQFQPFDEKKNKPTIPIVRVFSEGEVNAEKGEKWTVEIEGADKFVMRSELEWALKKAGRPPIEEDAFPNDNYMKTIPFKDRFERDYKDQILFIGDLILPVKAKARPIPMPHGGYCVLTLHGIKEIFHRLVYGRKAFQKLEDEEIDSFLNKLAAVFLKYFNADVAKNGHENAEKKDTRCHLFIKLSTMAEIEAEIDKLCKPLEMRQAKECSADQMNVVGRDFIRFEAELFNFERVFPGAMAEINNALEENKVFPVNKDEVYALFEGLQFGFFCRMFPELNDFVNTQEEPIRDSESEKKTPTIIRRARTRR